MFYPKTAKEKRRIEAYFKELFNVVDQSEQFIYTLPILKEVYSKQYFDKVRAQLNHYKTARGAVIHPFYNLVLRQDSQKGFSRVRTLEEYLQGIFSASSVRERDKSYVKGELCSFNGIQSLNMLFEIAVLGFFLTKLPDRIEFYPNTGKGRNVDLKVVLLNREVLIEVTALGDSEYHREILEELIRYKGPQKVFTGDIPKDARRIESRLLEKDQQFPSDTTNIVILSLTGSWLSLPEQLWNSTPLQNIGLIVVFDRHKMQELSKKGCNPKCAPSEEEEKTILSILGQESFVPLIY